MDLIKATVEDQIGTLSLNHYQKRNALSSALISELLDALTRMEGSQVKVLILKTQEMNPVWSAGHDVNELSKINEDPLPYHDPLEKLLRALRRFPAPIIAVIHGSVWGGACDVVMNCDIVLGDETCAFAITPAKLGVPYNISGIQHFLTRIPLPILKEMFFTAEPLSAERALQYHLVNKILPQNELIAHAYAMAQTIRKRSSEAITVFKEQAHLLLESNAINPEIFEYCEALRRTAYQGHDYNEGIRAFMEKRVPLFK